MTHRSDNVLEILQLSYENDSSTARYRPGSVGSQAFLDTINTETQARNLQRRLNTFADQGPTAALDRLFQLWQVDDLGVSEQDRKLLRLLAESKQALVRG